MTNEPSPPSVPYEPPGSQPRRSWNHFLLGLVVGSAFSLVAWLCAFKINGNSESILGWMLMIPLIKIVITVALLVIPSLRRTGAGVATSFLIGGMIFFGLCAMQ